MSPNSPRLVRSMIAASQAPGSISPFSSSPPAMSELVRVRLWPRREGEVHQVGNALLSAATIWILHTSHLGLCILIHESVGSLALGLVLGLCGLSVARGGVAGRRVGADAAVGVGEEGLGGGYGCGCRGGTRDLLGIRGSLGESRRLRRHRRRWVRGGVEASGWRRRWRRR
jgi:hypothetical protein